MAQDKNTTVGNIDPDVLAYTAGRDVELDLHLVAVDCLGTAAHVSMLSELPLTPPLFTSDDVAAVCAALKDIAALGDAGEFAITLEDQDVHLAVERELTARLGDIGKRVHTCRSRNDQVATDLRLYARLQLQAALQEIAEAVEALVTFGERHREVPMAGRTHMQPAMPSSVGVWATSWAEALLEDAELLRGAWTLNNRSPLGSAAGFGVPVPIDRDLTAELLGFDGLCHNVLHASNARGKMEAVILDAMGGVMLTLSRLAQDLMLYTLPEFGYFSIPAEFCTGSSIMPNKNNPDVLELVRGKTSGVLAAADRVKGLIKAAPGGYNRDIQEAKEPFMEGITVTRHTVRIMTRHVQGLEVHPDKLAAGFEPGVFATDKALELVIGGMPFRDAYHHVKEHLDELAHVDPAAAIAAKTHAGAPAGLDFDRYRTQVKELQAWLAERASAEASVRARLFG